MRRIGCVFSGRARRCGDPHTPPPSPPPNSSFAQLLDEHHRLGRGGRPRRTYKETLERFNCDYLPTLKPRTQTRYRTSFRQLNAGFGALYLDEITRARLADYASSRMKAGVTGATVRRDLATMSCLCSCAVAWDYIDTNPVQQFSKRHIRKSPPRTTYPTAEQVDQLVAKAAPRWPAG